MISRRDSSLTVVASAATSLLSTRGMTATLPVKARNLVLVQGLFADGSSWAGVIPHSQGAILEAAGQRA